MTLDRSSTDASWGRRRVAVVGMGFATPAGDAPGVLLETMLAGESVVAVDRLLDEADAPVRMAARLRDFDPTRHLSKKEARRLDPAVQLALATGLDALADAGPISADPARCAVVTGTGVGAAETLATQFRKYLEAGPRALAPLLVPTTMANAAAAVLSMHAGWSGPSTCVVTACASGGQAIGEGAEMIRHGRADIVLAGGFDAPVTPWNIAAFWRVAALSCRHHDPKGSSRPFDIERDGFVMGEGAAFLVLERWDRAVARGARILAELAGFGWNNDAYHLTAPAPDGALAAQCMEMALADAGLQPGDVSHINAHGTSTRINDATEAKAITKVFGPGAVPVTAPKGIFGHLIGGAGAVEAVVAILCMNGCVVPPVANLEQLDPDVEADIVRGEPRPIALGPVLSNSFAFGGHNVSLAFVPATDAGGRHG